MLVEPPGDYDPISRRRALQHVEGVHCVGGVDARWHQRFDPNVAVTGLLGGRKLGQPQARQVRVQEGRVTNVASGPFITPNYSFCLRATRSVWEQFWQPLPPPGYTDIFALVKQKLMQVEGDLHPFMANLLYFKDVIAAPRREGKR